MAHFQVTGDMPEETARDWHWSDTRFHDSRSGIKRLLLREAGHLLGEVVESEAEADLKHGVDYILQFSLANVAVRNRRPTMYRDLTIRSWRCSGVDTELQKLRAGDYEATLYFCGWFDRDEMLCDWMLVDIVKLVDSGLLTEQALDRYWMRKDNEDGRTGFVACKWQFLFAHGCLISSSMF